MIPNLIAALFAVLTVAWGAQPADPTIDDPVRVLSSEAEVRFPDEIVFTLAAESEAEITAVKLRYRFLNLDTTSYAYPDFRPSSRVNASYRLQTGGDAYVPAGATIEYHYEITNSDGRVTHTEPALVEYLDPRYEWRTLRTGNLIVTYHDRAERDVRAAAEIVDRRMENVKELLGLDDARPVKAVILKGRQEARRTFPFVSQTAHDAHLFGGFAYGEYGLFLLGGLDPDGMAHEATHVLAHQALDSPFVHVPAWLNEGIAMYFEPHGRHNHSLVERAVRSGDASPLRFMHSIPGRPAEVTLFYAQSRNAVEYLVDELGTDRMAALIDEVADGRDIDDAVRAAYGIGLDELDERWRAWLLGRPTPPLPETPAAPTAAARPAAPEPARVGAPAPLDAYGAEDVLEFAADVLALVVSAPDPGIIPTPQPDPSAQAPDAPAPDAPAQPVAGPGRPALWAAAAVAAAVLAALALAAALRLRRQ